MQKFILAIHGPMCSGKSTITKIFMQRENMYRGSYDAQKWQISNYTPDKPNHREIGKKLMLSSVATAVENGLSVILDGGLMEYQSEYKKIAERFGYHYVSINIESPVEVLLQRFLDRVANAQHDGNKKISVTTIKGFEDRYNWYTNGNKDLEAPTFNSSILSPQEIVEKIDAIIESYK
jgi:predicted kinase